MLKFGKSPKCNTIKVVGSLHRQTEKETMVWKFLSEKVRHIYNVIKANDMQHAFLASLGWLKSKVNNTRGLFPKPMFMFIFCFSPRAILNKALALRNAYALGEGTLAYPEYLAATKNLYYRITALPMEKLMVGLLNHACELWLGLATSTQDTKTILEVTTACLEKTSSLGNDLIFNLR